MWVDNIVIGNPIYSVTWYIKWTVKEALNSSRPISVCFLVFAYRSPGLQVFRRLSCVDHYCHQWPSPYLQEFYPIWDSVSFHFCLREASLAWNRGRVVESPCCTFLFRALPYFSQGGEEALLQRNVLRGAAVDSRGQPEATRGRVESMLWWCRWCRRCRPQAQGRSNRASKWRQKSHSSWPHFFSERVTFQFFDALDSTVAG